MRRANVHVGDGDILTAVAASFGVRAAPSLLSATAPYTAVSMLHHAAAAAASTGLGRCFKWHVALGWHLLEACALA